jgi:hypothetical protein
MMKAPPVKDAPPPPPPPQSPTAFSGKKKPGMGQIPIPTFLGTGATPSQGQTGGNTLLGQ